jgi:hypothetical protein
MCTTYTNIRKAHRTVSGCKFARHIISPPTAQAIIFPVAEFNANASCTLADYAPPLQTQFYTPIHSASKIAASSASPNRDFIAAPLRAVAR